MAQQSINRVAGVVASADLASPQRAIGGILARLELTSLTREQCVAILLNVGLPEAAFDDPCFPVSIEQDFQILDQLRSHLPTDVSMEVAIFRQFPVRAYMLGTIGVVLQTAPTILDGLNVLTKYPQFNCGYTTLVISTSDSEETFTYYLETVPSGVYGVKDIAETVKYAVLEDLAFGAALTLDVVQRGDRTLLTTIRLPYPKPVDWDLVSQTLPYKTEFDALNAAIVFSPGFLHRVPKRSHPITFKRAKKFVQLEAEVVMAQGSLEERVRRWLWAHSPPLKKTEVANLLGMSDRSLTRKLTEGGTNYNLILNEVQFQRAENLLENRSLSVAEVCYRMGFSDPAAFTRAFSGWAGLSPSQWRKRKQHDVMDRAG